MDMISGTLRHRGMLFAAASVVAMGLAASPASAQSETAADEGTESEIVVTGFRASLENALNAKRDSNLIIESVTAEDIGKFPDQNVAESLQRLPGIQIDRENGQGSKVRSEEHTSELQSLMRISYAVLCLKKKTTPHRTKNKT